MRLNVVVLDTFAETYVRRLRTEFPGLALHPVRRIADLAIDLGEIDVLITFGLAINDDIIARARRLRWIQSLASGVDHFLRCPSLRPSTLLTSARGVHGPAMREMALYCMLSLSHEAGRLFRAQAARHWDRTKPWPLLAGKTAVILGTGVSGSAIGEVLQPLGMHVIGLSRTPRQACGFHRIEPFARLVTCAAEADYLINVLPASPDNARLVDRSVFDAMRPTAFFINIGRGETVDEEALIDVLRTRRIAGAALDVFRSEPLPEDSPLWDLPNVVLTPHIGGFFEEYEEYVLPIVIDNMRLFTAGRHDEMKNIVPH